MHYIFSINPINFYDFFFFFFCKKDQQIVSTLRVNKMMLNCFLPHIIERQMQ